MLYLTVAWLWRGCASYPAALLALICIIQMVIGGTNISKERSALAHQRADLVIATPGRLQDHVDTTDGFKGRLWGVQVRWCVLRPSRKGQHVCVAGQVAG